MSNTSRRHPYRLTPDAYAEPNHVAFITVNTNSRQPFFAQQAHALAVIAGLRHVVPNLIAFCVMPDHAHFVYLTVADHPLPSIVSQAKGRIAHDLHRIGLDGEVWQRSYWDRYARKEDDLSSMVEYALNNPVRRELCERREEWPFAEFCGLPW